MQKTCSKCLVQKSETDFARDRRKADGLQAYCRACYSTYNKARKSEHPEKVSGYRSKRANKVKQLRKENPKEFREADRLDRIKRGDYYANWRKENKHLLRVLVADWRARNPDKSVQYSNQRNLRIQTQTVALSEIFTDIISAIYRQAREISEITNEQYNVDHIIPLAGDMVCGLHVPWNLRVITAIKNSEKGKTFRPEDHQFPSASMLMPQLPRNSRGEWLGYLEYESRVALRSSVNSL